MAGGMPIDPDETHDADLAAEALLLLRLALNDGEASERAMVVVRRVGWRAFGIDGLSMDRLEAVVSAYNAESMKAGAEFRTRSKAERQRLAGLLLSIARDDEALKDHEARLRGRLAALLDLDESELQ